MMFMFTILSAPASSTSMESGIQGDGIVIIGQNLESYLRPYVSVVTFGIDVAAGLIIGISAFLGLISFL